MLKFMILFFIKIQFIINLNTYLNWGKLNYQAGDFSLIYKIADFTTVPITNQFNLSFDFTTLNTPANQNQVLFSIFYAYGKPLKVVYVDFTTGTPVLKLDANPIHTLANNQKYHLSMNVACLLYTSPSPRD